MEREDSGLFRGFLRKIKAAEKNVIKELGKVLVVKKVARELGDKRLEICESNECGLFNQSGQCMECGCFMITKAYSEEHFDIKKGKTIITHCPKAMWDKKLDNFYIQYYNNNLNN